MMKAAVIRAAGGPEVLKVERLPIPQPRNDEVLIRVKAFGLNRSELFTCQGPSPNVKFPRVLGIEAVGFVESAPGAPLHLTQSEDVQYKLDGLVMLIEGRSTSPDGKAQFQAMAMVAHDDVTHIYLFRAYNSGHYVDTELTAMPAGFSWEMTAGPAHIVNTMHVTQTGEWHETTDITLGRNPPLRGVDMLLKRQP